ncbi:hypothetical protein [Mycolicibacterium sp.]|uniref:hypothetical protein n=1 Tax=Mycolicibacterium sp. TaxID=2320850 RepID=UPI001A3415E2|nr:hypothetical protein [Mycolicibacterium sp.]MBJ7337668.1 hypothetical protein [Mycolicibacterium sp.]
MNTVGLVVDAVFPFAASYAAIFVVLLAMNVALLVKLRSVIPQGSRVGTAAERRPNESSSGRVRVHHRKD